MYGSRAVVVFALISFTGSIGAASRAAGEEPAADVVHLAWIDPVDAASRCGPGAREEAARVFKAMGITAQWRQAAAGEMARESEIRVILLDRGATRPEGALVLGATPARLESRPFVWIHVPSVRQGLGIAAGSVTNLEIRDEYRLAIALGRVIAHEVVHAVAPGLRHGDGLMARRLTTRDLTAAALPVAGEVTRAVRAALSGEAARPLAETDLLAAEHAPAGTVATTRD